MNQYDDASSQGQGPSGPPPQPPRPQPGYAPGPGYAPYPPPAYVQQAPAPRQPSAIWKIIRGMFVLAFLGSVVMNAYLLVLLAVQMDRGLSQSVLRSGESDQVIAVYDIVGTIDGEQANAFARFAREVGQDDDVQAVVIRVDSGGGGVGASDVIHHRVQQLVDRKKAVVVSMGSMAASGGYYVSAAADEIYAEPTTVTGSIGVIMMWFVVKDTLDKIGFDPVVLKSTNAKAWKDELTLLKRPDQRQLRHLQGVLDSMQEKFEQVVEAGREGRLKTRTREITLGDGDQARPFTETEPFNGKIYLAEEAVELGLVDQIGYEDDAIERAGQLATLGNPKVVRYRPKEGLFGALMQTRSPGLLSMDRKTLEDLQSPRLMMIWRVTD
jgi:protease-4